MIGNDVVDLNLARIESNWQRRGFMDKLFSKEEQRLIKSDSDPLQFLWALWTRKEAVYKIINRSENIRAFIPLRITCDDRQYCVYGSRKFFTSTQFHDDGVFTVAVCDEKDLQHVTIATRAEVSKHQGLPFIGASPASISHHGRFEQVVYLKL